MQRLVAGSLILIAATLSAQTPQRRTANVSALLTHPAFYHFRPIVAVGKATQI